MGLDGKKCLFFVQGEGRGHLTQAISLKQAVEYSGIEVCEVVVGKSKWRTLPDFFYEKINAKVSTVLSPNMSVDKKNKGINPIATFFINIFLLPKFIKSLWLIHCIVKEHKPDIIINFYEPLCGLYYLLFRPKVPNISIAHHYMYLNSRFKMPKGDFLIKSGLKLYTSLTAAGAKKKLALSFYPFSNDEKNSIFVVPPLLREEAKIQTVENGEHLLIYLLNNGYIEDIIKWHRNNPAIKIHCFTDKKDLYENSSNNGTLFFHKLNDQKFLQMMANSKAVVTTAGFETVCESIYMGKPIFMVPVEGHYEQFCNARDAVKTGCGMFDSTFNISNFLKYLENNGTKSSTPFIEWAEQSPQLMIKHMYSVIYENNNVRPLFKPQPQYSKAIPY